MRFGVGLPAAIPKAPPSEIGEWARSAEDRGFSSVAVIDRLVYDNHDPIVALAVAAASTETVELITTVLNVAYRRNALVLAKQMASLDLLSGGRFTAGLGVGGWPEDHAAVGPSAESTADLMEQMLGEMALAWSGSLSGASGPMPATPQGSPRLLFGGFVPAAFSRAARYGRGWVAPSFGLGQLRRGIAATRKAFADRGRTDEPRIVVERYFCLGDEADDHARRYISHYYGEDYAASVIADTLTSRYQLEREIKQLADAGCHDLVFLPCIAEVNQIDLLADALDRIGLGLTRAGA